MQPRKRKTPESSTPEQTAQALYFLPEDPELAPSLDFPPNALFQKGVKYTERGDSSTAEICTIIVDKNHPQTVLGEALTQAKIQKRKLDVQFKSHYEYTLEDGSQYTFSTYQEPSIRSSKEKKEESAALPEKESALPKEESAALPKKESALPKEESAALPKKESALPKEKRALPPVPTLPPLSGSSHPTVSTPEQTKARPPRVSVLKSSTSLASAGLFRGERKDTTPISDDREMLHACNRGKQTLEELSGALAEEGLRAGMPFNKIVEHLQGLEGIYKLYQELETHIQSKGATPLTSLPKLD